MIERRLKQKEDGEIKMSKKLQGKSGKRIVTQDADQAPLPSRGLNKRR